MKGKMAVLALLALFAAVAVPIATFTFVWSPYMGPFPITTDVAPPQKGSGEYHVGWYLDGRARVMKDGEVFYIDLVGKRIKI